ALSETDGLCGNDHSGRVPARRLPLVNRRRGGAAFRVAALEPARSVISALPHLFRLGGVGFVCAREGIFGLVDPAPLPPQLRLVWRLGRLIERPSATDAKHRLSTTVTALGPTYVKLGQFLATRPDVVGPTLARDLESLQDSMPPFSQAEAEKTVAAALDKKLCDVFATFGPPVAAASIAQVHRAEIETPQAGAPAAARGCTPASSGASGCRFTP